MSINHKQKVIVGMSGGVDSSVSALLLKQQGYHVEGLFMKNWEEDDTNEYCSAAKDVADAAAVCEKIGINLHTVNFSAEYWDNVFAHFLEQYRAGRTPNPDVLCNKEIKFRAFLDYAQQQLAADFIATGHYARKCFLDNQYQLLKGLDRNKDQTYFLYLLDQQQLSASLFPLGELEKNKVRKIAAENELVTYNKKDSTGICFIGERKFKKFLSEYIPAQPGNIETLSKDIIGSHDGLMYYTYGQRQGLKIGGKKTGSGEPWYVIEKDLKRNVLIVAQGKFHQKLYRKTLICDQLHWISGNTPEMPYHCQAKTRYNQDEHNIDCSIRPLTDNNLEVTFATPQRAITPGQSVVFYQNEICLGGGIIN